jgi:hypothetical protein
MVEEKQHIEVVLSENASVMTFPRKTTVEEKVHFVLTPAPKIVVRDLAPSHKILVRDLTPSHKSIVEDSPTLHTESTDHGLFNPSSSIPYVDSILCPKLTKEQLVAYEKHRLCFAHEITEY